MVGVLSCRGGGRGVVQARSVNASRAPASAVHTVRAPASAVHTVRAPASAVDGYKPAARLESAALVRRRASGTDRKPVPGRVDAATRSLRPRKRVAKEEESARSKNSQCKHAHNNGPWHCGWGFQLAWMIIE
jgi:hypothetical protein